MHVTNLFARQDDTPDGQSKWCGSIAWRSGASDQSEPRGLRPQCISQPGLVELPNAEAAPVVEASCGTPALSNECSAFLGHHGTAIDVTEQVAYLSDPVTGLPRCVTVSPSANRRSAHRPADLAIARAQRQPSGSAAALS